MAHHNNTPRAVLLADQPRTPLVVSTQSGQNRAGRRHLMLDVKGRPVDVKHFYTIPKAARQPATNVPYVKADH